MSRTTERVSRDLGQIADQATPSSSAWDSIRTRIDAQTDEPDVHVLRLNAEDKEVRTRPWLAVAAVAAAVVSLAVVVGVVVMSGDEDSTSEMATEAPPTDPEAATEAPATDTETASPETASDLELATQFLHDLHSLDAQAVTVMEADAIVSYMAARSTDDIPGLQGVMEARGSEFTVENCEEVAGRGAAADDESTTRVECDLTFEDAISKAAGLGPYPGSLATVWIEDGAVTLLTLRLDFRQWFPEVGGPFGAWLSEAHPEDQRVMHGPEGDHPAVTAVSVALWEQYTAEYIAEKYG